MIRIGAALAVAGLCTAPVTKSAATSAATSNTSGRSARARSGECCTATSPDGEDLSGPRDRIPVLRWAYATKHRSVAAATGREFCADVLERAALSDGAG